MTVRDNRMYKNCTVKFVSRNLLMWIVQDLDLNRISHKMIVKLLSIQVASYVLESPAVRGVKTKLEL